MRIRHVRVRACLVREGKYRALLWNPAPNAVLGHAVVHTDSSSPPRQVAAQGTLRPAITMYPFPPASKLFGVGRHRGSAWVRPNLVGPLALSPTPQATRFPGAVGRPGEYSTVAWSIKTIALTPKRIRSGQRYSEGTLGAH